jgi:exopolyphosphatase / guanosine-5'-triphosphate,3'-diphosphate pyrophosphatase
MRVAALDLGTNTFILLVAEVEAGRVTTVFHDEVRVVRLGQGVHGSRRFHPEALERARQCFADFARVIESYQVHKSLACATSAARDVENGHELVRLAADVGIPVEIITGEKEAELTFLGAVGKNAGEPVVIVDVGGGSTEYIFGDRSGLVSRTSLDIGSVRLTEMFVTDHPIAAREMQKMREFILQKIEAAKAGFPNTPGAKLLAVAGTPTTLATLDQGHAFESERVHGYVMPVAATKDWVERLSKMSIEERRNLAGMEPKRADVIVAGAMILQESAEILGATAMEVSIRGLRYGVAIRLSETGS